MDLESIADELYALHPAEFTQARTARVNEALAAGRGELAARIAALRRPTLSAWASNLLVRSEPGQVRRLLRLGEGLRPAGHARTPAGTRDIGRRLHDLVEALALQARRLTAEAGHPIGEAAARKVEQTLHAALRDPDAAGRWASGRLVRALGPPVGFPAAVPAAPPFGLASAGRRGTPRAPGAFDGARATASRAQHLSGAARTKADRARARRCEREYQAARTEADRAAAVLRELEERATELARQLHAAVELRRRARDDADRAAARAEELGRAAQRARQAARTGQARAERSAG